MVKWISVEEQLPSKNGYYFIAYKKAGNKTLSTDYCYFSKKTKYNPAMFRHTYGVYPIILYWSHVPKPPKSPKLN